MPTPSPLQYHMNDLVYYLGLSVGGNLDKQISIMERMAAMATGMTMKGDAKTLADIQEFTEAVMFLRNHYFPAMDSNPYLVPQTRRMKIAVNVVSARAFFLVDEYKLITGGILRSKLLSYFGKDRYLGDIADVPE